MVFEKAEPVTDPFGLVSKPLAIDSSDVNKAVWGNIFGRIGEIIGDQFGNKSLGETTIDMLEGGIVYGLNALLNRFTGTSRYDQDVIDRVVFHLLSSGIRKLNPKRMGPALSQAKELGRNLGKLDAEGHSTPCSGG